MLSPRDPIRCGEQIKKQAEWAAAAARKWQTHNANHNNKNNKNYSKCVKSGNEAIEKESNAKAHTQTNTQMTRKKVCERK